MHFLEHHYGLRPCNGAGQGSDSRNGLAASPLGEQGLTVCIDGSRREDRIGCAFVTNVVLALRYTVVLVAIKHNIERKSSISS